MRVKDTVKNANGKVMHAAMTAVNVCQWTSWRRKSSEGGKSPRIG